MKNLFAVLSTIAILTAGVAIAAGPAINTDTPVSAEQSTRTVRVIPLDKVETPVPTTLVIPNLLPATADEIQAQKPIQERVIDTPVPTPVARPTATAKATAKASTEKYPLPKGKVPTPQQRPDIDETENYEFKVSPETRKLLDELKNETKTQSWCDNTQRTNVFEALWTGQDFKCAERDKRMVSKSEAIANQDVLLCRVGDRNCPPM